MCAEKISEMEEAMRHVLDMKKNLERERKVFTAAAVRLNKEVIEFFKFIYLFQSFIKSMNFEMLYIIQEFQKVFNFLSEFCKHLY